MSAAQAFLNPRRWWRSKTPMYRRNYKWGLVFATPAFIGLAWFFAYPAIASIVYSFSNRTMTGAKTQWVGGTNYSGLFKDSEWWSSLGNTFYIMVLAVPIGIVVAVILALLLNLKVRGQSFYRTIFFLPSILPVVASGVVWLYVFNPQYGVLNNVLSWFGINGPGWLQDPNWAKPALVIFSVWGLGNLMVIMLAGLQEVPQDLQEQAMVDGANWWHRFWHVTVPFISPHLMFALITGVIAGFQYFTPVYVLTNGSGDPAGATMVSGVYLYQNAFQNFKVGYASAMAWVLFIIIAVCTALLFKLFGKRVYYGGE
ncbi:spermidine/putrescine ABC transporter permease [Mangrovactinospora gilvigrisea]|uniref:Spermidine/putrescine ABC transporter permease n=1 Tax=Mangrovactinospora gilvigrisea TaxID=1428644 RepID=A0A1J7BDN9_9ACTN|nr:sugar ABC transporter permease [Mangrovactinospora gilvigrisea]OIV36795.1 spermidine/putrescine ABC transporter permease [Mangrovactinospora gilvigrisea]